MSAIQANVRLIDGFIAGIFYLVRKTTGINTNALAVGALVSSLALFL